MKNNKGYTLVELLVTLAVFAIIMAEVGSMMMNSSKLYRNGTYEVELQTEAQQIVQQMEELLIDVNHSVSVSYQAVLGSDFITVSNNSKIDGTGDYTIYNFTVDKDPDLGYGTLYFNKTSSDGSGTVVPIPMAEYVQSISLNMDGYAFDVVTLNVSMNNGRYGYQASQDIYLRNRVGSGGGGNYGDSSSYDFDVDILRLRNYDLNDYLDSSETFEFTWSDDNVGDPTSSYSLNSNGSICVNDGKRYTQDELGPFIVDAVSTSNPNNNYTIKVSTKPPMVGVDGKAVFMTHSDSLGGSYLNNTPIPVQGVAVEAAKITITLMYQKDPFGVPEKIGDPITMEVAGDPKSEVRSSGEMKYDNNTDYLVELQNYYFVKEPSSNCFQIHNSLISGGSSVVQQYYNYIVATGKTIYFKIEFDWGHNLTRECLAHMYVVPANPSERMPEGTGSVFEKFWDVVGL